MTYINDAANATVKLAKAPIGDIGAACYNIAGVTPIPTAAELVAAVKTRLPDAEIIFEVDDQIQSVLDNQGFMPVDDSGARADWGWKPTYDLQGMVDDFLRELHEHPERYA